MGEVAENAEENGQNEVWRPSPAGASENSGEDLFPDAPNDVQPFGRPTPISRGRPPGSPNKRTVAMRETYLKLGLPHPMLWAGRMLQLGPEGLARELDCTLAEAFDQCRKLQDSLLPYFESRMPTQIAPSGKDGLPVLIFGELKAAAAELRRLPDGAMAIDDELPRAIEQYQRVREGEAVRPAGERSHETPEAMQNQHDRPRGADDGKSAADASGRADPPAGA